jgi:DUF2946 family protein
MSRFRSNIQSGTWLALLALTLQMAVSFGHMHRHDLGLPPLIQAGQTQTLTDEAAAPADLDDHHSAPDHYCPICASIALIGTGAPAPAPVLVVPTSVVRFSPPQKPAYLQHPQFTVPFQARGPPSI